MVHKFLELVILWCRKQQQILLYTKSNRDFPTPADVPLSGLAHVANGSRMVSVQATLQELGISMLPGEQYFDDKHRESAPWTTHAHAIGVDVILVASFAREVDLPGSSTTPTTSTRSATRFQHGIHEPKNYTDGTIRYGCLASLGEPHNLEEALSNEK